MCEIQVWQRTRSSPFWVKWKIFILRLIFYFIYLTMYMVSHAWMELAALIPHIWTPMSALSFEMKLYIYRVTCCIFFSITFISKCILLKRKGKGSKAFCLPRAQNKGRNERDGDGSLQITTKKPFWLNHFLEHLPFLKRAR